jgi:hypothetical protein
VSLALLNLAAADFPIVSSWNCDSSSVEGTGESEKKAVPTADTGGALSLTGSPGATIGSPSATVYLFRGVGLMLDGRFAPGFGGGSPLGDGLLAFTGGDIARDMPDADEIDEFGTEIPSPRPSPVVGRPAIESGRVAEVSDDGGECDGEKVPSGVEA